MEATYVKSDQPGQGNETSQHLAHHCPYFILHGIFMAAVYWTVVPDAQRNAGNVALWIMFLTAAADIVAGVAMWLWKLWGIYLYGVAAAVGAVMAVLATGDLFLLFGAILPAIIVLYIVMRERAKFE